MEKKNSINSAFSISLFCIAICVVCAAFTGCATTARTNNAANGDVLSYQREIARLESSIERYNDEIGNSIEELGRIRERASGVEGTIDEVIYLFEEYQRGVERLLQRYRRLQEDFGRENNSLNLSGNLYDNSSSSDSGGVHSVLQGNKSSEVD